MQAVIRRRFQTLRERRISTMRIRCHGDYHLGQVLYTGKDFVIIDFEGEPARPLSIRRMKRCRCTMLRDAAVVPLCRLRRSPGTICPCAARGSPYPRPVGTVLV